VAATAERQAHFLLRSLGKADRAYEMLRDGDRVAVAVSGGKDSLALLQLLDRYRRIANVSYDLAAIHVRGDATGVTAAHQPLEAWLAACGLPYRSVEPELNAGDTARWDASAAPGCGARLSFARQPAWAATCWPSRTTRTMWHRRRC